MKTIPHTTNLPADHLLKAYSVEKKIILQLLEELQKTDPNKEDQKFYNVLNHLQTIEKRFERKENQLFPYLELENGWSSHTQRMWSFHDTLRAQFRILRKKFEDKEFGKVKSDKVFLENGIKRLLEMEDDILFPYCLDTLSEKQWKKISEGEAEIGWMGGRSSSSETISAESREESGFAITTPGKFKENTHFDEGYMSIEQVNLLFKTMPFDITYVDENDKVIFYNRGDERLFPRSPGIIGREVKFCHPPKSVGTVLKILEEFKRGNRNDASFWINIKGRLIYIRYFAVRDLEKNYKGVIEISQDISDIKNIEGEKRLLDWD